MRDLKDINLIVVHCADTTAAMDIGAEEIRKWHTEERGWSDIGYHYVIRRNGKIEDGRDLDQIGAHVKGFNKNSIGICLVGGKPDFNFTRGQMESLRKLLDVLEEEFPGIDICGHRDLDSNKTCPNFDVKSFLEW